MKPRLLVLQLREDLDLSQVEFGRLLGVHFMSVSKWERGIVSPNPYQLALIRTFASRVALTPKPERMQVKTAIAEGGVIPALRWLLQVSQ